MYCITREDIKFGEYFIPARTRAIVISKLLPREVNLPGVQLFITVKLFDIRRCKSIGEQIGKNPINNELEEFQIMSYGYAKSQMTGIEIITRSDKVYLGAEDPLFTHATLSKQQVKNILGENVPGSIIKAGNNKEYLLFSVIRHMENEFAQWVHKNCKFYTLNKQDIEDGEAFTGAEPGDRMLTDKGYEQFYLKQLEYKNRLETTGWTFEFEGGLKPNTGRYNFNGYGYHLEKQQNTNKVCGISR